MFTGCAIWNLTQGQISFGEPWLLARSGRELYVTHGWICARVKALWMSALMAQSPAALGMGSPDCNRESARSEARVAA